MKANPGGTVTGDAIIGRSKEIEDIWSKLEKEVSSLPPSVVSARHAC